MKLFLGLVLSIGLILGLVSCTRVDPDPNVIIILADDQAWGDLSFNGNPIVETPNIDALATEGAVLENFFVDAVCSPTRAALLSGKYAVRGGVYSTSQGGEILDYRQTIFPQLFQNSGYKTGAFGKWHNGSQPPFHPNHRGFDEFVGYTSGHWGNYFDATLEHNGEIIKSKGYLTDYLTDRALKFIEKEKHQPFLLYLPLNTPHSPMQVPDKWWKKFEKLELPPHRYSEREKPDHSRAAYAMAENIDWNVGRIIKKLEELKIEENTLIIYFSDNGPNGWRWNGGMEGIKGSVDEGGVKSACIFRWKGHIPHQKIGWNTSVMDVFPTLLDMANIGEVEENSLDGRSIKNPLLGKDQEMKDRLLVNYWKGKTSIRSQQFRLSDKDELFDMYHDPAQRLDLSDSLPHMADSLLDFKLAWEAKMLKDIPKADSHVYFIGNIQDPYDKRPIHLPARDAHATGSIKRLSKWPNCSFFTHWTSENDSIYWDVKMLMGGKFEATLYASCQEENIGTQIKVGNGNSFFVKEIMKPYDPPLFGSENDRVPREESLVKDFKPLIQGQFELETGLNRIRLLAPNISKKEAIDVSLLVLRRL